MSAFFLGMLSPAALVGFTLWAAWLALAAESEGDLPRADGDGTLPLARRLHIAHLALLVIAGAAAATSVVWWAWPPLRGGLYLALAVTVVWVVGDLLPRLLAAIAPELARLVRPGAARSLAIFRPLFHMVTLVDQRGMRKRLAPLRPGARTQRDAVIGVFALSDMTVAEVMTPRIDIVSVDVGDSREEVVSTLSRAEHARLPVFEGQPDAVAGVVYAKDMLAHLDDAEDDAVRWTTLIRPVPFVPEGKTLDRQLRDFQRGPSHLAVVVDEFGGTAGLITLEDILEQVVGEIHDEYDVDEVEPVVTVDADTFRVLGGVALTELEALFHQDLGHEDVSTVGGLVLAQLGRVPRAGDEVRVGEVELRVEQVSRRRVRRVLARRVPADGGPAPGEAA
ncbi:MAG TPA: hemolysin family protein [Gemmatimonadales bacterium]|nr:hemolysin family protein [Gemmatimonadales bacterium]